MTYEPFVRKHDCLIVAGNGPSIKNINYKYFPYDYDIFRCNQFYLEDKYYLGKRVDLFFFNHSMKEIQEKTAKELIRRKEYDIRHLITNFEPNVEYTRINEFSNEDILMRFDKQLYKLIYNSHSNVGSRVTTGMHMLSVGYALGYKQIYLTGIDFYKDGHASYCHDLTFSHNLKSRLRGFDDKNYQSKHSKEGDLFLIDYLIKSYPEVKLYSLSDDSELKDFTEIFNWYNTEFVLEEKPFFYLNDIVV